MIFFFPPIRLENCAQKMTGGGDAPLYAIIPAAIRFKTRLFETIIKEVKSVGSKKREIYTSADKVTWPRLSM